MTQQVSPAAGFITVDTPCRQCGYNLRGLPEGGRCPECGVPVGVSLHGDLLRFCRPQWLLSLKRGVDLTLWALVIMILGTIANAVSPPVGMLILLLAAGCNVAGSWLLTAPDPSGLGEDQYGTARKIIRFSLLVGVGERLVQLFPAAIGPSHELHVILVAVGIITGIIGVVGQFALLSYLSKIAMRIPDQALSDRASFLMYAFGISYGILIVVGAVVALAGPSSGIMAVGCVAGIVGVALIVFAILYLFMMVRLGKAFKAQGLLAEGIWAAEGAR